ncbi:hypothetical protein, partial [Escherichia coli]|uniref:hypothetical protein n=1 Tax=Escherichia coli TaxID=562 RepID=UPI001BFD1B8B
NFLIFFKESIIPIKYNKINHTNIKLSEMKTRLWKLREYDKSKNSNYYVSPRRAIFLKEVQNWK